MKTISPEEVKNNLNERFVNSFLRFELTREYENSKLPVMEIRLKEDMYINPDYFTLNDKFYEELEAELLGMGINGVMFNNTRHTFWWITNKK